MRTSPQGTEGIDRDHKDIIDRANPIFYCLSTILIFYTLLNLSWFVVLLWSCAFGVLGVYLLFRNRRLAPNLLLHLKPVIDVQEDIVLSDQSKCVVCGDNQCSRHPPIVILGSQDNVMPWTGFNIPETIDNSLTKFLDIIIERFIDHWHSDLTESCEFTNEARVLIRHAVCLFLHRVAKIDIPKLVTGPLLQTLAEHMHIYITIRKQLPVNASPQVIENQILKALGSKLHIAMRGNTANFRYFKNLVHNALPYLLSSETASSRVLQTFLEELLSAKVMIPAMDYVASPDFLNKIVILIFDKNSKLCRLPYPVSRPVSLLEKFAKRRKPNHLQVYINEILKSQKLLYPFMQYLKRQHAVQILQLYLDCNEVRRAIVKSKIGTELAKKAHEHLDRILHVCDLYSTPSIDQSIIINIPEIEALKQILSRDISDLSKISLIVEQNLLDRTCNYILIVLQSTFCSSFYHSQEYHSAIFSTLTAQTRRSILTTDEHSLSRQFEKWRSRRKRMRSSTYIRQESTTTVQELSSTPPTSNPVPTDSTRVRSSSLSFINRSSSLEEPVSFSLMQIQVVDYTIVANTVINKPYTIYTIVSKQTNDGKTSTVTVRRRYKEFVVLNSRIQQFYSHVNIDLPAKRAFHNMDKQFIETRMRDLESYLQKLTQDPEIRNSQLLKSFLSDTLDSNLFMPDTVGDRAGKMIKSALKKEPKGQHLDNLLLSMDSGVTIEPRQPHLEKQIETDIKIKENAKIIEQYNEDMCNDLSNEGDKTWLETPYKLGDPVFLNGIMDLLVYLAIRVYNVSHLQLTTLLAVKMITQSSVEAFFHDLLSNRIELVCQEHQMCELIELLQDELFFNKDPPRTNEDKAKRKKLALDTVLNRPPNFIIKLIGEENFYANTSLLLEGLQNQTLNKQLLFCMLDIAVLELFPEL